MAKILKTLKGNGSIDSVIWIDKDFELCFKENQIDVESEKEGGITLGEKFYREEWKAVDCEKMEALDFMINSLAFLGGHFRKVLQILTENEVENG